MGAGCTNIFIKTTVNQIKYYSPGFDCIKMAGILSLFVGWFCPNIGNGTLIQTVGALGESSDEYDELFSLGWNSSGRDDPKLESGGKSWRLYDWPNAGAGFRDS